MTEYEDSYPQRQYIEAHLSQVSPPSCDPTVLSELLYTACETGMLYWLDSLERDEAIQIWKLVQLTQMLTKDDLDRIRM